MTSKLLAALDVYHDDTARSAAMNMAIDEALLEACGGSNQFASIVGTPPPVSFGYFGKFADVASYADGTRFSPALDRRWNRFSRR